MLFKKEGSPYSFLDLKMGTDTVLRSKDSSSYQKFASRDQNTTTAKYGFRLMGFTRFGAGGKKEDSRVDDFAIICGRKYVKGVLRAMLSDYDGSLVGEVVEVLVGKLRELYGFLNSGVRGKKLMNTSLFFVFDRGQYKIPNIDAIVDVKMIDIGHMETLKTEKDEGYLEGLRNLITLILSLKH